MKNIILFSMIIGFCLTTSCSRAQNKQADTMVIPQKILIVYLTRTNNTKAVAEMIHQKIGGVLAEIAPLKPYPANYKEHVSQVADENNRSYLPPLKSKIDISGYDTIFVGFPTWDMQVPPPLKSFLKENNWKGKTIVPFNTNAGFGLGSSKTQFEEYCNEGKITDIFTVKGGYEKEGVIYVMEGEKASEVSSLLDAWLKKTGLLKN